MEYEIIVADDGSTDSNVTEANARIADMQQCRYIATGSNRGRAAIRNFLAGQSRFGRLLFMDCDIELPDDRFLQRYAACDTGTVVYGGVRTEGTPALARTNIRYIYEHAAEPHHTAQERNKRPYKSFRTTNFSIDRDTMLAHPFDERFRHYGYEDVFFGKELRRHGITIRHIDNPVVIRDFEPNDVFIAKTEEGLRTLHDFRDELNGYSNMLDAIKRMRHFIPTVVVKAWHRAFGQMERRHLCGQRPSQIIFNMYRLGYYMSLAEGRHDTDSQRK